MSENTNKMVERRAQVQEALSEFDSLEQKQKFKKMLILGYLSKGSTKKAAAEMAGVDESTFYRWAEKDPEFKGMADACLGGEDELIALYNVSKGVRKGDPEYTKFLLNKRKYYEKRYDPKYMEDKTKELAKNPVTGVFEVMDTDDIITGLLGERFESNIADDGDQLEKALYEEDNMV
jgi:hypothetical protein